jgi:DNA-binding response OmpR family regulator
VPTARLAASIHPDGEACASLVPTYIGRLRRQLGTRFIETLPGVGYRLTPPEQVSS